MKIIRIFDDIEASESFLWAARYVDGDKDEFSRLFDLWMDVEYLEDFFETNKSDLQCDFWGHMGVEEAVEKALAEAYDFMDMFYEVAHGRYWKNRRSVHQLFQPLDNRDYFIRQYQKHKSKPQTRTPFLRLYAVRLEDDVFVITGGAIKLTFGMESGHLDNELRKMEQVKRFLTAHGITYLEDLFTT
jgi:hypothetical protein